PDLMDGLREMEYGNEADYPKFKRPEPGQYELNGDVLTQETYFKRMQDFLAPPDVILAEQGTSFFGAYDLALYKDNKFVGQPLWGS
ncbi:alpha-keto acid decarboxylase family protein, partial [Klebsiella oxytoca]